MIVNNLDNMMDESTMLNVVSDHGIRLCEGEVKGCFQTEKFQYDMFHKMVVSWNGKTSPRNSIEVKIRVKREAWSDWFSYGKWTTDGQNGGSIRQSAQLSSYMDIDEICDDSGLLEYQLRVDFFRCDRDVVSPELYELYVSTDVKRSFEAKELPNIDIEVPMVSQMMIDKIGNIACSPTAMSMVLNYYGHHITALDTSKSCFDNGEGIYGNWSYNIAFAGECGFDAFVDYCYDIQEVVRYIQRGIPIVASVKTKDIIKGAPQAYPEGHLLVIRGFLHEDEQYIIVNDPASKDVEHVKRYYKLSEFLDMWRHVIYVIKTRGRNNV